MPTTLALPLVIARCRKKKGLKGRENIEPPSLPVRPQCNRSASTHTERKKHPQPQGSGQAFQRWPRPMEPGPELAYRGRDYQPRRCHCYTREKSVQRRASVISKDTDGDMREAAQRHGQRALPSWRVLGGLTSMHSNACWNHRTGTASTHDVSRAHRAGPCTLGSAP